MLELGDDELSIHRETGEELGKKDIDILIGVRGLGSELVAGASAAGLSDGRFVEDSDEAGDVVCDLVRPGDVILIKGSRGVKTEKVVEKLLEKYRLEGKANGGCATG
jgi:UDP-N-acetylmuramoyl-tripeptide--D-alanyl-D-alanine ligase